MTSNMIYQIKRPVIPIMYIPFLKCIMLKAKTAIYEYTASGLFTVI